MRNKFFVFLILIFLSGFFLRVFNLGSFPVGITGDEIQQGYTAYSILKTGKDEWGDFLPLNPRGFGDYKPPLYSYLTIPFVALFGLNIFAVRIVSALASSLTILVIYFLTKELFDNGQNSSLSKKLGLIAATFFAFQPWQIFVSRIGWESNLGLLLFSSGVLFFVKSFRKNYLLTLSILSFGLSTLSYHSFKLLTLLFLAFVVFLYRKTLLRFNSKVLSLSALVLIIFVTINAYGYIFSGAGKRAADSAIYSEDNLVKFRQIQTEDKLPDPFRRIINNKYQYIASEFIQNYLGYFSFDFIFSGLRSNYSVFNMSGKGILYIWELPMLLFGLFVLIKQKPKWFGVILVWLMLAPIPAALTKDYMHAGRAEALLPIWVIISTFGLYNLWKTISSKYQKLALSLFLIVIIWSVVTRADFYLYQVFNQNLGGVKYGYKQAVDFAEKNSSQYDQIIFTKTHSQPQIFVAFYSKMNPDEYQQYSKNWKHFEKDGFKYLDMIDYSLKKYEFKNIDISRDKHQKNSLIISSFKEAPSDISPEFKVSDLKSETVFVGVDTNELK